MYGFAYTIARVPAVRGLPTIRQPRRGSGPHRIHLYQKGVIQPWKAVPVYRFRERRVRPLCHLVVRQQTWQKIINSVVAASL